ncbi:DUF1707 and FHA domain-containing protein [Streptomyces smaragdinus]|uniref:DUF1707 and FHA domain-containing protein n=1 Tax=Streptomyces smaragdinus TaxID=2585196 RepID=UPI002B1FB74A|nr:DUF1707 and FHA domain-containing protein [Streptomyces smaragdinus]
MSVNELPTPGGLARVSDRERDRALDQLREGAAQGLLSQDTFLRRMELVLEARARDQLDALISDLPKDGWFTRTVVGSVAKVSAFGERVRLAWQTEKLPPLVLPTPRPYPLRIGRDPVNGLRLMHDTVSRVHAELLCRGGAWIVRDLGSSNGTFVNGHRITGSAMVKPGDQVGFGETRFRLTAG